MLIEYSFDLDYVAVPCSSEREAIKIRDEYIYKEIEEERNTIGYTPIVRRYEDDLTVDLVYSHDDVATYRVIEIGHNYFQKGE